MRDLIGLDTLRHHGLADFSDPVIRVEVNITSDGTGVNLQPSSDYFVTQIAAAILATPDLPEGDFIYTMSVGKDERIDQGSKADARIVLNAFRLETLSVFDALADVVFSLPTAEVLGKAMKRVLHEKFEHMLLGAPLIHPSELRAVAICPSHGLDELDFAHADGAEHVISSLLALQEFGMPKAILEMLTDIQQVEAGIKGNEIYIMAPVVCDHPFFQTGCELMVAAANSVIRDQGQAILAKVLEDLEAPHAKLREFIAK